MALTDLTRISTSGIATGTSLSGAILHNDAHFRGTQVGVTSALFDSSDNALELGDNVKLTFGNLPDFSIAHNTTVTPPANQLTSNVNSDFEIIADNLELRSGTGDKSYLTATVGSATTLFFNDTPRFKTTDHGAVITGILTATSFSGPTYNTSGIATFYDLRVSNNLTVEGTTTTLDTNLIGVDRVEVGADSNTIVGVAVTQSGTADLVNLFDGASQVVTVDDTGKVGLGTDNPSQLLHLTKDSAHRILLKRGGAAPSEAIFANEGSYTNISNNSAGVKFSTGSTPESVMVIRSGGNVGLGTDNPSRELHVLGTGEVARFQSTNSVSTIRLYSTASNHSEIGHTGDLYFAVNGERLRIQGSTGNVGIGSATPSQLLELSAPNPTIAIKSSGSDNDASIELSESSVYTNFGEANNGGFRIRYDGGVNKLLFDSGLGTAIYTRLSIQRDDGQVGVNTSNPLSGLHISDGTAYGSPQNSSRKATLTISAGSEGSSDIQLLSANYNHIFFGDSADPNTGIIWYEHTGGGTDSMNFSTAGTQKIKIDSSGNITNTGIATSFVTTQFAANFAKLDLRGTNIANSNHYILSYGAGHANNQEFHMVNTLDDLVFRTGSGSPTERLRIHVSGKVSIGSTETSTGLLLLDKNITAESDVSDKNNYHLVIRSQSNSNTSRIGIAFANTTDDTHVGAAILHHRETTDSVGSIALYTSQYPGITSERFRVTRYGELGLSGANYGTDGQVLTSGGAGEPAEWRTIVQAPVISSISGSIVANLSGTTLTLSGQHFGTGQGIVNFSGGSLNPSKNVNVTPTSDTSMTVTVPSNVATNVNSGETITIKFTNSAGLIGSGTNTTVIAAPSGGTITTSGNYRIHTFTSSSNFVLTKAIACEYLVIAGGGGGGGNDGGQDFSGGAGGGGAGGYRTGTITPSANTHTVTVGGGGAGNNSAAAGGAGGNSAFGSVVSNGGGGGGGCNNAGSNGNNGGSGGGAAGDDGSSTFTGGSGTAGQGNAGGNAGGSTSNAGGGGGGGAGAVGETAANGFAGGDGGAGSASSITGSSVTRAGGGGGSVGAGTDKGLGGAGGGGNGAARSTSNSTAGSANTGGGGGAGADSNVTSEKAGANGGSGIVIVRYDITNL